MQRSQGICFQAEYVFHNSKPIRLHDRLTLSPQTFVSASGYASNRSSLNFPNHPASFDPSRWLASPSSSSSIEAKTSSGPRSAFNPFSLGPRNCLGRNLAYLEMRLILAHLLWAFDLKAPDGETVGGWEEQKSWILWEKAPLRVKLRIAEGIKL